jgi:hypothetical protein
MGKEPDWEAIRKERKSLVDRVRALPFDAAWDEVRAALESSPSIYSDNRILTVYEGPIRSFLLPLPFELLRDFVKQRGALAADHLVEHAADRHPLVAAYCLHALSELGDSRLPAAAARVANRSERIQAIYGCFGWEGTLAEYGQKLHDSFVGMFGHE